MRVPILCIVSVFLLLEVPFVKNEKTNCSKLKDPCSRDFECCSGKCNQDTCVEKGGNYSDVNLKNSSQNGIKNVGPKDKLESSTEPTYLNQSLEVINLTELANKLQLNNNTTSNGTSVELKIFGSTITASTFLRPTVKYIAQRIFEIVQKSCPIDLSHLSKLYSGCCIPCIKPCCPTCTCNCGCSCRPEGDTCTTYSDCCPGLVCSDRFQCERVNQNCKEIGFNCNCDKECCGGFCDYNRRVCTLKPPPTLPPCVPLINGCKEDSDCCSELCDASRGKCVPYICIYDNDECHKNSDCCSEFCDTTSGTCQPKICSENDFRCHNNKDCCSGFCDTTTETCRPKLCIEVDHGCLVNQDCCSKNCDPNTGNCICAPDNSPCRSNPDCCMGNCNPKTRTCESCFVIGERCRSNKDCCLGICSPETLKCESGTCVDIGERCQSNKDCCLGICNPKTRTCESGTCVDIGERVITV